MELKIEQKKFNECKIGDLVMFAKDNKIVIGTKVDERDDSQSKILVFNFRNMQKDGANYLPSNKEIYRIIK